MATEDLDSDIGERRFEFWTYIGRRQLLGLDIGHR